MKQFVSEESGTAGLINIWFVISLKPALGTGSTGRRVEWSPVACARQ